MEDNYYELELALSEAIEAGETHVVVCLLKHLFRKTLNDISPILISIRAGHLNILEILLALEPGRRCPKLLPSFQIPLHQAMKHGRTDMAELLLDRGANIQTQDDKKRNAIFETLKAPNTDGMSLLLDRGIRVDCPDSEGNTVLHHGAMYGPVEHARLLIYQGMIDRITSNNEGLMPLHLAIRAQQFEIADMLLEREGVDVNIKATGQAAEWTPLMYAVRAGSLKLCDKLIQMGARVDVNEGPERRSLDSLAVDCCHGAIYDLILSARNRPRHLSMSKTGNLALSE